MAEQKRNMVMDIVVAAPQPKQPVRSRSDQFRHTLTRLAQMLKAYSKMPGSQNIADSTKSNSSKTDGHPIPSKLHGEYVRLALICIVIVIAAIGWHIFKTVDSGPIPYTYRHGLKYSLYYPTDLPPGYRVKKSSFTRHGDVLIFSIIAPNGKNIAVSEEPRPANLDLSQSAPSTGIALPDQRAFTTGAGSAEISLWGDNLVSSLIAGNTWVILNVTGFQMNAAQQVTQAFTSVK